MTNVHRDVACHVRMCAGAAMLSIAIPLLSGCTRHHEDKWSRVRPPVFETTGRIVWNGEPAAGAMITLQSQSHNVAASGRTNAKGEFVLTTYRPDDGAVAGDHTVTIVAPVVTGHDGEGNPIEVNVMPQRYEQPDTSGLSATISESGKNVLSFDVTGPRREAK